MKNLFAALIKAQSEFPEIPKNKTVKSGSYVFHYADLAIILEKITPKLNANGLAVIQTMIHDDSGELGCVTKIIHSSGESLDAGYVPVIIRDGAKMQDIGGAITYAKRYSIQEALGICAEDDLDANDSDNTGNEVTNKTNASKNFTPNVTNISSRPKENNQNDGDVVTVEAVVPYEQRDLPRKAGFAWNKTIKKWLKDFKREELEKAQFEFEVREVG